MLSTSSLNSLVFIDPTVDAYPSLAAGVISQAKAIILNPEQDGIEQITQTLTQFSSVQSIHIIAHGQPGELLLGSARFALSTIDRYVNHLRTWASALGKQAEILLYGCSVAAGESGATFLKKLNQITGAHIAGSSTPVGNADLGGNWNLDITTGAIASPLALRSDVMANYPAVLAVPNLLYAVSNGNIYTLNLASGGSSQVGSLQFQTFATARQAATGFIYYISTAADNPQVAYWNPATGTNTIVGNTGTAGVQFLKLAQAVDGNLYGMDSVNTAIYRINSVTGAATNIGNIADVVGTPVPFAAGSGDIAFDPTNPNRLFVLTTGAGFYRLYSVDITTLQATYLGDAGLSNTGSGSLAFGQDGQLYSTSSGTLYRLNYQLNQPTLSATAIGSSGIQFDDFATVPTPTDSIDLSVTKTDGLTTVAAGSQITYTITVTNPANTTVQGISLQDIVPAVITGVTWSAASAAGVTFPTAADQSGSGNTILSNVNLAAGTSVVYTVRGTVSATATPGTVLTNDVVVSLPPGLNDPNGGNNTGRDTSTITQQGTPPGQGGGGDSPDEDGCKPGKRIRGNNTDNRLVGTPDADVLRGFRGGDRLFGRACGDLLIGNFGNDMLSGGGKRDRLRGNQGNDMLYGDQGRDRLNGGLGNDMLDGGIGRDRLKGGRGEDMLIGNKGNDFIVAGANNDFIQGNNGNDTLIGNQGDDQMRGHAGRDNLRGGLGNDDMTGGTEADQLRGGRGNDSLQGNEANDVLFGNLGQDFLSGGQGRDRLRGGFGQDLLRGGGGADFLQGGVDNDRLNGWRGADTLVGFWGADVLIGGLGADRFVYTGLRDRGDRILDFTVGQDVIDISRMINDTLAQTLPATRFVRFTQVGANTLLQVNVNGTGAAGFVTLATLTNVTASSLSATSVIV